MTDLCTPTLRSTASGEEPAETTLPALPPAEVSAPAGGDRVSQVALKPPWLDV